MADFDTVVFDTEPLVAHADDEPGASSVNAIVNNVRENHTQGSISYVNLTEVRYILARKYDRNIADEYIMWLLDVGIDPVDIDLLWEAASDFVIDVNPALGDAFALATAAELDATLIVGGDDDYDDVEDVSLHRFRDGSS